MDSILDPSPLDLPPGESWSPYFEKILPEMASPDWVLSRLEMIIPDIRSCPIHQRMADMIPWSTGPNSVKGEASFLSLRLDAGALETQGVINPWHPDSLVSRPLI